MNIDYSVLRGEEAIVFALRSLYRKNGYTLFKMSNFEEYDLYVRNKDFLYSDRIITFTDTNGRLLALKPDVTLSIVNNSRDEAGVVQKLCYNESVYRASDFANGFKEQMQVGIECIGDLCAQDILSVPLLAAESLKTISENAILEISHLDILSGIMSSLDIRPESREGILRCISEKNPHVLLSICTSEGIDEQISSALSGLLSLYGTCSETVPELKNTADALSGAVSEEGLARVRSAISSLEDVASSFEQAGLEDMLRIDLSVTSSLKYYNGLIFSGFIPDIPNAVLSGGQYDSLMKRIGRKSKAIGFAVYMDELERLDEAAGCPPEKQFINIALPKGRLGERVYEMFSKAGFECPSILENSRKLIFENKDVCVRYFWAKPSDVATYVERGTADIGVAGKDILLEYGPDVYELADLKTGNCRMCVAGPRGFKDDTEKTLKVATKFTGIARSYYSSLGRDINIIHLNGSIEIAPILGLSDVIVDIVETGTTLKENDLEVLETIVPISARLIANKSSYKFKSAQIRKIQASLQAMADEDK